MNYKSSSSTSQSQPESNYGFIELQQSDLCYIDEETCRALELLENNVDPSNRRHSLMGYLNMNTSTTSGTRLLRDGIIRPLCHLRTLEHRLDCIEYLVNRIDTLSNLTNSIRRFGTNVDLESVAAVLVNLAKQNSATLHIAEKRLDAITTIQTLASQVIVLVAALECADQHTLNIYKMALEDPAYQEILEEIDSVIESDIRVGKAKRTKMFRIKQGVDPLFDMARSTYNAAISDLEQYVRELHKEDNISWRLNHSETRGYFLTVGTESVPKGYVFNRDKYLRFIQNRTQITCTTVELMQSNNRANLSYENSMKLANEILKDSLGRIMNNIAAVHKLVEIVGMLDLITSFAKLAHNSHGSLTRPRFTACDTIITKGRHPILESVLSMNSIPVIPNDTMFSVQHKNFMLVTGPNMGGKSIYLKQVGLIQIMAQLGCYVPAASAHIKLMNRIVARSGTSDDNNSNCSSFMWEMKGIASALITDNNPNSQNVLYIIDEVGRGTSIDDGASYSFAIAEELASRKNCFTVFATHFDQVFTLTLLYNNVIAYYFKYEETDDETDSNNLRLGHSLVPGIADKDHYGIRLAEACGLPSEIIQIAKRDLVVPI